MVRKQCECAKSQHDIDYPILKYTCIISQTQIDFALRASITLSFYVESKCVYIVALTHDKTLDNALTNSTYECAVILNYNSKVNIITDCSKTDVCSIVCCFPLLYNPVFSFTRKSKAAGRLRKQMNNLASVFNQTKNLILRILLNTRWHKAEPRKTKQ